MAVVGGVVGKSGGINALCSGFILQYHFFYNPDELIEKCPTASTVPYGIV